MIRIGAVSYLNTKPLIHGLAVPGECAVELDLPSRLAARLAQGDFDAALVPVAALFGQPDWAIVSDACIACRGPVWSVKLCGRVPLAEARSIGLDVGSLTSVVLAKTLLAQAREARGLPGLESLRFQRLEIDADWRAFDGDAVLVIGDRAMGAAPAMFAEVWDLGQRWWEVTGLPFVFAAWAARPHTDLGELSRRLAAARDLGLAQIQTIAAQAAGSHGLTAAQCLTYLTEYLHFRLGPRELVGLETFYRTARDLRLAPAGWELQWNDCQTIG